MLMVNQFNLKIPYRVLQTQKYTKIKVKIDFLMFWQLKSNKIGFKSYWVFKYDNG